MIFNLNNYSNFFRIFIIIETPLLFIIYILTGSFPKKISVKTPIGKIELELRNYESLKTIFSIFCRLDYNIDVSKYHFIDIGANCGYSAAYFLSRNKFNTVECYEPDEENYLILKRNLSFFKDRFSTKLLGVGPKEGEVKFYITDDGKYSSTVKNKSKNIKMIQLTTLNKILENKIDKKIVIKIDIEGLEKELVQSTNFNLKKNISKLIIESLECKDVINRNYDSKIINGYVEHFILL